MPDEAATSLFKTKGRSQPKANMKSRHLWREADIRG